GQVDLGGRTRLGAAHGVGQLTADRPGAVLMNTGTRRVDQEVLVVAVAFAQAGPEGQPEAAGAPSAERGIGALPGPELIRKVPPRGSGAQDPEDRLNP